MASGSTTFPQFQRHDPAWAHCQTVRSGDRTQLKCIYCGKKFSGGGIHRIKEHLAGQKGNTTVCPKVLPDVQFQMQHSLLLVANSRKKPKIVQEISLNPPTLPLSCEPAPHPQPQLEAVDMELLQLPTPTDTLTSSTPALLRKSGKGVPKAHHQDGKVKAGVTNSFAPNVPDLAKKAKERAHTAIGRFLYDADVPLHAVNSAYFQPMIDAIAAVGPGLLAPTCHDLRGWILNNSVEEAKHCLDQCKQTWVTTGCSLMAHSSSTNKGGTTLIDFLVYCPQGTMFLRSVDATVTVNSVDALYSLFIQVVEEVGVGNVVQLITDDHGPNYVNAGRRLTETYPSVFWTPCSVCCIDLILQDIGKLGPVNTVIGQAKSITRFIYNHGIVLNMMRKHTVGGKEFSQPIVTSFASNFINLQCVVDLKDNLKAMVTSQEWSDCTYSKHPTGIAVADLIFSSSFWSSCIAIVRLTRPLVRVLHTITNDERRPSMGYIYEGMMRAKEAIKKELKKKKKDYIPYLNIINLRWDKQLHRPLHAAGFFLNPLLFYNAQGDSHNEIMSGMLDCIERLVPDIKIQDKLNKELLSYKNASGDFGRNMAVRARRTLLPAEWWSTYGGGCPNLQRLAVRILSQTCSARGCEQDWSVLERIHKKRRNRIEHRRRLDLIFVQYNLRLQQRQFLKNTSSDPISLDNVDTIDDWLVEDEMPILGYGEDSNWVAIEQPLVTCTQTGSERDEIESLVMGFEEQAFDNDGGNYDDDDDDDDDDDSSGGDDDDDVKGRQLVQ